MSTYEQLGDEMLCLKRQSNRYRLLYETEKKRADQLERRLFGALYQIYGSWQRVNKELGRA